MTGAVLTPGERFAATLVGAVAILLWTTLAVFTVAAKAVPPFQLVAMTFAVGGLAGLGIALLRGRDPWPAAPPAAWALGVSGLLGYHALYFLAFALAPAGVVNLVNYLWPLLIVLFAGLLPGGRLRLGQLLGAAIGFAGVAVLLGDGAASIGPQQWPGVLAGLAAAVTWAGYSVLNRRHAAVETEAVAGFCLASAALAALLHLALEHTTWPPDRTAWAAVLAMGLGPAGLAFFAWDHGTKRGDLPMLGLLSYATPVASTVLLVLAGFAEPSWSLALACAMVAGGAALGSRRSLP